MESQAQEALIRTQLAARNMYSIASLTGLEKLPTRHPFILLVGPMPIGGGSAAPASVMALTDDLLAGRIIEPIDAQNMIDLSQTLNEGAGSISYSSYRPFYKRTVSYDAECDETEMAGVCRSIF